MIIEYALNEADAVAFHTCHNRHVKKARNIFLLIHIGPVLLAITVIIGLLMAPDFNHKMTFVSLIVIYMILWIPFYPLYWESSIKHKYANSELFKKHLQGIISPNEITLRTDMIENKIPWKSIVSFIETNEHIFLYITHEDAFIIPKRAFPDTISVPDAVQQMQALYEAHRTS